MNKRAKLLWWNQLFAPTGEESQAGELILRALLEKGYNAWMDDTHSVTVKLGGEGEKLLSCVPYDQKGMLITGQYQAGGYFLNNIGRWDGSNLPGEHGVATGNASVEIRVHEGAENYKAPYNLELNYVDCRRNVDMIGNKAVFPAQETEMRENGKYYFSVSMLDNRAACLTAEAFIDEVDPAKLNREVYVTFLALDTCCFRAAVSVVSQLRPDSAIVISCKQDEAWKRDALVINHIGVKYLSDPVLVRRFSQVSEQVGTVLEHRFERPVAASAAVDSADSLVPYGCRTLSVSLPVRREDWLNGYVSEKCLESMVSSLVKLVTK